MSLKLEVSNRKQCALPNASRAFRRQLKAGADLRHLEALNGKLPIEGIVLGADEVLPLFEIAEMSLHEPSFEDLSIRNPQAFPCFKQKLPKT